MIVTAKHGGKCYKLKYVTREYTDAIKVDVEYKKMKGGIEALGFGSSNYTKEITVMEHAETILIKKGNDKEKILSLLQYEIEKNGYVKALEKIDTYIYKETEIIENMYMNSLEEEMKEKEVKKAFKPESKKQESISRKILSNPEKRKEIREYLFNKRAEKCLYDDLVKGLEKDFGFKVHKTTINRLLKEACKERGIEYVSNSEMFFNHKDVLVGWIKSGMQKDEVIGRFNDIYGMQLNKYYYSMAEREAKRC